MSRETEQNGVKKDRKKPGLSWEQAQAQNKQRQRIQTSDVKWKPDNQ